MVMWRQSHLKTAVAVVVKPLLAIPNGSMIDGVGFVEGLRMYRDMHGSILDALHWRHRHHCQGCVVMWGSPKFGL